MTMSEVDRAANYLGSCWLGGHCTKANMGLNWQLKDTEGVYDVLAQCTAVAKYVTLSLGGNKLRKCIDYIDPINEEGDWGWTVLREGAGTC